MSDARIVSDPDMEVVSDVLRRNFGFVPTGAIRRVLIQAAHSAASQLGVPFSELISLLAAGDGRACAAVADHGLIGETYFFRCAEQWEALLGLLSHGALGARESLRIWSAGCSTGEEPYSLAMALIEAGRAGRPDQVLGTDASEVALARAGTAKYSEWSLRQLSPARRARFFEPHTDGVLLRENVRRRVSFSRHNLISATSPLADCDLILCRNVLIYFELPTVEAVLSRLMAALRPGGFLLVAPSELPLVRELPFERVELAGATLFQRPTHEEHASPSTSTRNGSVAQGRAGVRRPLVPAASTLPVSQPRPLCRDSLGLAKAAADRGQLEHAELLAREALDTRRPEAHVLLAMLAEARGDLPTALAELRKALYLEPELVFAHVLRANVCRRLGEAEQAEQSRLVALELLSRCGEEDQIRGAEQLTAGALRRALAKGAER